MIVCNKAQCTICDDIIESICRHDFTTCSCGNLSVDGGLDYLKRSGNMNEFVELSEFSKGTYVCKCGHEIDIDAIVKLNPELDDIIFVYACPIRKRKHELLSNYWDFHRAKTVILLSNIQKRHRLSE